MASLPQHPTTSGRAGTNLCSPRAPSAGSSRRQPPAGGGSSGTCARTAAVAVPSRSRRQVACAAFTEQDRSGTHRADGCGQGGENGSGAEAGPLRERLAAATTAGQLHQLLLRHAGELQGPEVAAALEAAAKRRLLSGTDAAAGGGRGGAALAQLLVQLAAAHAPAMAPASLAASAWSMGVLQLPAARPVLRAMHATAHERLTQYQPSQLCALLWAGSVLDPSFHSPLFLALAGLLQQGMSLSLFAPADLAMLGWLCGREGGAVARDVLLRLTDECRLRLEAYRALAAEADAERERGAADAAGAQLPGINWVHDTPVDAAVAAVGVKMRVASWKRMVTVVKCELSGATGGEVLAELELRLCSQPGLNPLVVALTEEGRVLDRPLDSYASYKFSHKVVFRIIPRMHSLQRAAAAGGQQPRSGGGRQRGGDAGEGPSEAVAALSVGEAGSVLRECEAAAKFWEAVTPRARQAALAGPDSFSAAATLASGRRLLLTWRRQGTDLLPAEITELPSVEPAAAAATAARWAAAAGPAAAPPPQQRRRAALPPPPFGPAQAALLLSGLAAQQLRVGGVVEPLLQQCRPALRQASADDVARIVIALGELQMEPAAELFSGLIDRLSATRAALSPRQAVSAVWAAARLGSWMPRVASLGVRHLGDHLERYEAVDVIGMLWACVQLNGSVPDATLAAALRRLPVDQLQQCSNSALCNLVWAVGRLTAAKTDGERAGSAASKGRRPTSDARGLAVAARAAAAETAAAAVEQLAARARGLTPHEAAAAAVALAAHASHATALPPAAVAALRAAAAAAAAADALGPADLANLSLAAARLRWTDPRLLDPLAAALHARSGTLLRPGDVARAMAALAPAAYGPLFASLAASHVARLRQTEFHGNRTSSAELQERAAELAAFAAVAQVQGLPKEVLLELLSTAPPSDLRRMPPAGAVAALELAAAAGLDRGAESVRACCAAIRDAVDDMSADELRQTWSVLRRLRRYDPALVATMDACLAKLPPGGEPPLLVEGLAPLAPLQPPF